MVLAALSALTSQTKAQAPLAENIGNITELNGNTRVVRDRGTSHLSNFEHALKKDGVTPVKLAKYKATCTSYNNEEGFKNCALIATADSCNKFAYKVKSLQCCCDDNTAKPAIAEE